MQKHKEILMKFLKDPKVCLSNYEGMIIIIIYIQGVICLETFKECNTWLFVSKNDCVFVIGKNGCRKRN